MEIEHDVSNECHDEVDVHVTPENVVTGMLLILELCLGSKSIVLAGI